MLEATCSQGPEAETLRGRKTPLNYNSPTIQGAIAVEATNTGGVFYVGSDQKLYGNAWRSADNPVTCKTEDANNSSSFSSADETHISINNYKTDEPSHADSSYNQPVTNKVQEYQPSLLVYPNPSKTEFNFRVEGIEPGSTISLFITDIRGAMVYKTETTTNCQQWNSIAYSECVYYYSLSVNNNYRYTGKLIKY